MPPFCHDADLPVLLDESLLDYETVWATAGAPTAVFPIGSGELRTTAEATPVEV